MRTLFLAAALIVPLSAVAVPAAAQSSREQVTGTAVADAHVPWLERHRAEIVKVEPTARRVLRSWRRSHVS